MSISTSFLSPPDESESRAERARRKHTPSGTECTSRGWHPEPCAESTQAAVLGALFPTKRSGDIPTVELHSKIRRTGRTHGSTGEYERDEPLAGVDVHMHGRARLQVDSIVLQPEPWVMTSKPTRQGPAARGKGKLGGPSWENCCRMCTHHPPNRNGRREFSCRHACTKARQKPLLDRDRGLCRRSGLDRRIFTSRQKNRTGSHLRPSGQ